MKTRAEFLDDAKGIITRDRNRTYGPPEDLFAAIELAWTALDVARGDRDRGAADVGLYMAVLKAIRASANPAHLDSFTDGCGYFACAGEIAASETAEDTCERLN